MLYVDQPSATPEALAGRLRGAGEVLRSHGRTAARVHVRRTGGRPGAAPDGLDVAIEFDGDELADLLAGYGGCGPVVWL